MNLLNRDKNDRDSFQFNTIYVIESLPNDEEKTGKTLYDETLTYLTYKHEHLEIQYFDIESKQDFFNCLIEVKNRLYDNFKLPYIHFEIHGHKGKGLYLKSEELVSWAELSPYLIDINVGSRNNLVISLSVCFGGHLFSILDPCKRCPFLGFVGPLKEMGGRDLLDSYQAFFERLFDVTDYGDAVKGLNKSESIFEPFFYWTAEALFELIWDRYLAGISTPEGFEKKIDERFELAIKIPQVMSSFQYNFLEIKKELRKNLLNEKANKDKLKSYFLMLDLSGK